MIENEPITITTDDVQEANQLSLHCPICASAVENHNENPALNPVVCVKCGTLYHKACWEQSGGKCAILGCGSTKYRAYGQDSGPVLKISMSDLPKDRPQAVNGTQKRIKEEERRRAREQYNLPWWARWFQRLLRAIKILE
jgi:hypothetical protein